MTSPAAPPPAPTPPSIEASVQEHLDVIHQLRELRREMDQLGARQLVTARMVTSLKADVAHLTEMSATTARALTALAADVGRLADGRTTDSLTLQRIERSFTELGVDLKRVIGGAGA